MENYDQDEYKRIVLTAKKVGFAILLILSILVGIITLN